MKSYAVISGPSSGSLAQGIAAELRLPLIEVRSDVFPDGETRVRLVGKAEASDCILVQSMYPPVDRHLFQGLLLARKLSLDGYAVHGVIPYLPYARQDRAFLETDAVSAELVACLLESSGMASVTTVDIHSGLAASHFAIPLHNLTAVRVMADFFVKNRGVNKPLVISPDFGGSARAREFAEAIGAETFVFEKHRDRHTGEIVVEEKVVPASGRNVVIVDDMISTGGTVVKAAELLAKSGARRIFAICTHPLLVGNALEKIMNAGVSEVIGTNSIPSSVSAVDLAPLIAEHLRKSLSSA
ncbi:MAG: ribose-phosphate pyrophosphokinase [Thaumarchaeota archaeon]|nr:ribose-phosphate pyrophosphokinase [Nitrososphaerota archaeon]